MCHIKETAMIDISWFLETTGCNIQEVFSCRGCIMLLSSRFITHYYVFQIKFKAVFINVS
jgi:hypothetical protein